MKARSVHVSNASHILRAQRTLKTSSWTMWDHTADPAPIHTYHLPSAPRLTGEKSGETG